MERRSRTSLIMRAAAWRGCAYGLDPLAYDRDFVAGQLPVLRTLFGPGRWFELDVAGWDHLPEGPVMLVSNHSGGTTGLDGLGLGLAWYQAVGVDRPLHGLAHDAVFATHGLGHYLERCGMLRARQDLAQEVAQGLARDLLVMPGGDRDVWRPARDRFKVCFGGRTGYARTAARLGIPIVPVAHAGAHHTLHVLTDGHAFAQRVGVIRRVARAEVFPLSFSLPWGFSLGPLPHLPPPTLLSYRIGRPIPPPRDASDLGVRDLDDRVRGALQEQLDGLRRGWSQRPRDLRTRMRRAADGLQSVRDLREVLRSRPPPASSPTT